MNYNVLMDGYLNKMVSDDNGVKCVELDAVTRKINGAVTTVNTQAKVLAYYLAKVKAEGLWQKGAGWDSYEAFCREWNISKSDASRYAAVGSRLKIREEDGKIVTPWALKTVDFTYGALVELITVDDAQIKAWLDDGTLTLNAKTNDCRKAKKMLKGATDKDEAKKADDAEKAAPAPEPENRQQDIIKVRAEQVLAYQDAMKKLLALTAGDPELLAAAQAVDNSVTAIFGYLKQAEPEKEEPKKEEEPAPAPEPIVTEEQAKAIEEQAKKAYELGIAETLAKTA